MTVLLFVRLGLFGVGLFLLAAGAARRNTADAKRCPKCRYDVSKAAQKRCSECGYQWSSPEELLRRPRRKGRLIAGVLALTLAVWLTLFGGSDWTSYLPRPALSAMLHVFVPPQPIAPGSALPAPDAALSHSQSRWERLVWQKQAAQAVDEFLKLVEQSDGTIDAAQSLLPAAREMGEIYKTAGGTRWVDSFPLSSAVKRVRQQADALDAKFKLPLGTWIASELQHHYSTAEQSEHWITPPLEVIGPLSRDEDAQIRSYALQRLIYIRSEQARQLLEAMLDDPDETIAGNAESALYWRREVRQWDD